MALHMYNFTLQNPGAVTHAIAGNFVDSEPNQILVARGHVLELLRFDGTKTNHIIASTEVFGVIRSLSTFRLHCTSLRARFPFYCHFRHFLPSVADPLPLFSLPMCALSIATTKDYIVVGSDSGRISILEFVPERNAFAKVHEETFGRSGARRIVPGQYLAVDPAGRATMIGAVEKQKFVYILNRDNNAKLTISSPLEAHKSHSLVFDMIGVDVGFQNPLFATLEMDYGEADSDSTGAAALNAKKSVVWYELDLGLNHVVRKSSDEVDRTAHKLIAVPGATESQPGGILICAKSAVYYRSKATGSAGFKEFKAVIPRRLHTYMTSETGDADDGVLITSAVLFRLEGTFWWLLQTEHGDLFQVSLQTSGAEVTGLRVQYMDTVPPAAELVFTATYLHVFANAGNHYIFNVLDVPSAEEDVTFEARGAVLSTIGAAVAKPSENGMDVDSNGSNGAANGTNGGAALGDMKLYFKPRALRYLSMTESESPSLSPILDLKVAAPKTGSADDGPQILALCGSGPRSSLSIMRHGIQIEQKAVTPLERATGVWMLKTKGSQEFDQYIVVSFDASTLVLAVSGEAVRQISETDPLSRSFSNEVATLNIGRMADDTIVQIHGGGIRHIRSELSNQEMPCPSDRKVLHSAINDRQIALALSGTTNNLVYYESDGASKLSSSPHSFSVGGEILAVALQPVPANRQRARFLAVAVADDKAGQSSKILLLSLDPAELFQSLSVQILNWRVSSLSLLSLDAPSSAASTSQNTSSSTRSSSASSSQNTNTLILGVGAVNGIFSRFQVDANSGEISDSKDKALGSKPVRIFPVKMPNGAMAMCASSSRPWLLYSHQSSIRMLPLCYPAFEHAYSFHSELCRFGVVCVTDKHLAIFSPEGYSRAFDLRKVPLSYTPRQSCLHPNTGHLLVVEADHNADPLPVRQELHNQMTTPNADADKSQGESPELPDTLYGAPKPGPKQWGSVIRMIDLESGQTLDCISLDNNEAAVSITTCSFSEHSGEVFVCVGTAKDLVLQPKRSCSGGFIHVYSIVDKGRKLRLLHKKPVKDIPGALTMYDHRLLAGIGKSLKIYDLGKRNPQLLRKCENNSFPNHIVSIATTRERIIVGDIQESVHFVKYSRPGSLSIFADDSTPRWMTSFDVLDYNSVAGSDKFGNVFVLRLPDKVARVESADATTKASPLTAAGSTGGSGASSNAAHKLELACCFHVGETVTRVQKIRLTTGGAEFLLYATVFGTIGALLPLTSRASVDFFSQLELYMRQENAPICGRDHLAYRSAYSPVKNVVDGDLLEQFATLPLEKQKAIAEHLDHPIADISRRIEDIRGQL